MDQDQIDSTIRELMLTVEYLRRVCEHTEWKNDFEWERMRRATTVGTRVLTKYRPLMPDFQHPSWWTDVSNLPKALGL